METRALVWEFGDGGGTQFGQTSVVDMFILKDIPIVSNHGQEMKEGAWKETPNVNTVAKRVILMYLSSFRRVRRCLFWLWKRATQGRTINLCLVWRIRTPAGRHRFYEHGHLCCWDANSKPNTHLSAAKFLFWLFRRRWTDQHLLCVKEETGRKQVCWVVFVYRTLTGVTWEEGTSLMTILLQMGLWACPWGIFSSDNWRRSAPCSVECKI